MLSNKEIQDIIEWDVVNWSVALRYWDADLNGKTGNGLELGGKRGGLSYWMSLRGLNVVCSDLESPENVAAPFHAERGVKNVEYEAINAMDIQHQNAFDNVAFKSILGGIAANGKDAIKKQCLDEMYKALKPGGTLYFAENLEASGLHRFFRKKFVQWGGRWNYVRYRELNELFASFDEVEFHTVGFFGAFGRTEKQRKFFGTVDKVFKPLIPKSKRYIVYGVARKKDGGS